MPPRVREILDQVAATYGLTAEDLLGRYRKQTVARPRQEAMFKIRRLRRADGSRAFSFPAIAEIFGDRDHTSVMYACRKYAERNGIIDEDNLKADRASCLATIGRAKKVIDNATARINKIDAALGKVWSKEAQDDSQDR
jgi:hypothetical protein